MALETGNEEFRKNVLNKNVTNENLINATELFKKYKIKHSIAMMLGLPGETIEYALETLDFYIQISNKYTIPAVNIFKPYPKLKITEYGVKIGQYDESFIVDENMIGDTVMNFYDCLRKDEIGRNIINLSRLSYFYIKFPYLRNIIKNKLIYLNDSMIFKFIYSFSQAFFQLRHHVNSSWLTLFKISIKHWNKNIRA